jgi:WD40 repeat protein
MADGMLLHTLEGHAIAVNSLAFSPDGSLLAGSLEDETIRIWGVEDGMIKRTLEIGGYMDDPYPLAFSPDGRVLISGGRYSEIRYWGILPEP